MAKKKALKPAEDAALGVLLDMADKEQQYGRAVVIEEPPPTLRQMLARMERIDLMVVVEKAMKEIMSLRSEVAALNSALEIQRAILDEQRGRGGFYPITRDSETLYVEASDGEYLLTDAYREKVAKEIFTARGDVRKKR